MVTDSDPINNTSLILRMQTLEPHVGTPQIEMVVRNKDVGRPSGP